MALRKDTKAAIAKQGRVVLNPLTRRWLRGPAWVDGDDIVMDVTRAEAYQPLTEPKVGLALTKVKTAEDAVAFVRQFGLLQLPGGLPSIINPSNIPRQVRQPLAELTKTADHLRGIVETARDVRRGVEGDHDAVVRLRDRLGIRGSTDDRTVLIGASDLVAGALSRALHDAGAWPQVYDRASVGEPVNPGLLRIGILPETLRGFCYLTIAVALSERERLDICPECGCAFHVEDARQVFCSPKCASRFRFKKYKTSHETRKRGSRHGKKTR